MMIDVRKTITTVGVGELEGAWGILVMLYILFLVKKKKNGSFNHVKTQQTVHISIYISLCIPQEKNFKAFENKMI